MDVYGYVLLCTIAVIIFNKSQGNVTIYGSNNKLIETQPAVISCFFDNGEKPAGTSGWFLNGKPMTQSCNLEQEAIGTLNTIDSCYGDTSTNAANFTFEIISLHYNRDATFQAISPWMCRTFDKSEVLTFDVDVQGYGYTTDNSQNGKYYADDKVNIEANYECSYPESEVLWCLSPSSNQAVRKCSDEQDWHENVFDGPPHIEKFHGNCSQYKNSNITTYNSILNGSVTSTFNDAGNSYRIFAILNDIEATPGALITLSVAECCITLISFAIMINTITLAAEVAEIVIVLLKVKQIKDLWLLFGGISIGAVVSVALDIAVIVVCDCKNWHTITAGVFLGLVLLVYIIIVVMNFWRCGENSETFQENNALPSELKGVPVTKVAHPRDLPKPDYM